MTVKSLRFLMEAFGGTMGITSPRAAGGQSDDIGAARAERMFPGSTQALVQQYNLRNPDDVTYDVQHSHLGDELFAFGGENDIPMLYWVPPGENSGYPGNTVIGHEGYWEES